MKKLLLSLTLLASFSALQAQCGSPQSQIDIHGNNIQARILNGGDLFTDFNNAQFIPNPSPDPGIQSPATIFAAGLWMGGVDPSGNLKLAAVDYRNFSGSDFSAGPLSQDGITNAFNCANWDRIFRVTGAEIAAFIEAQPLSQAEAITQFPDIMGWPANGNTTFAAIWGYDLPASSPLQLLAPFYDANADGVYSPLSGDYPAVQLIQKAAFVPAEIIWCVFNDQKGGTIHPVGKSAPIQMEIQLTAWAFNCPDEPALNNTIFTSHKLINRASEDLDPFYVGFWVDFDLGCYADDYVGCSPSRNTMFAYNQDAVDGNATLCSGVSTFGDNPPVQTVTFLKSADFNAHSNSMDKFLTYNNGHPRTTHPETADQYYNNLKGLWKDGTPLTYGNSGYGGNTTTNYLFPSDPSDQNGWSMCTSNMPADDRQVLGTQKVGLIKPGQILEFNTAWSVHNNAPPPCNLGNALNEVDIIRAYHDNNYAGVCSPITKASILPANSLDLFPNPTGGNATLRYGSIRVDEIRMYDASGKLLQTLHNLPKTETTLQMNQFPAGMYTLRLLTDQGSVTKKLAVVR